jgi:hypothetical protein
MARAPGEVGCGLRVQGRDIGINFSAIPEAELAASRLMTDGYTQIEIFDRGSGRVIGERTRPAAPHMRSGIRHEEASREPLASIAVRR